MLVIDHSTCTLCMECIGKCPFDALSLVDGNIDVNAACRLCKICVKACPVKAIAIKETAQAQVDKSQWQDILVYIELNDADIHPVGFELIGKAKELAGKMGQRVHCLCIGHNITQSADSLLDYGVDRVLVYDDPAYRYFTPEPYADAFADAIGKANPSVVLVGATAIGRSLAPKVATRFRAGLTADCTMLDIRENTDLVQIRPAFGGNIMAQIISPNARPQFATVRYKVMDKATPAERMGKLEHHSVPEIQPTRLHVLGRAVKSAQVNISEADVLVAAGRGLKNPKDLAIVEQLAELLGGQVACSRPLVEAGWLPYTHQIGLSGRTVKPKLIITCGISGAVQFTACMKTAECVIAINSDPEAPIFKSAHYGIVGDVYEIVPQLIERLEGRADQ